MPVKKVTDNDVVEYLKENLSPALAGYKIKDLKQINDCARFLCKKQFPELNLDFNTTYKDGHFNVEVSFNP